MSKGIQYLEPMKTENGLLNGHAVVELPGGRTYDGHWERGLPHGPGIMNFPAVFIRGTMPTESWTARVC